jgi:hypothetical protein
MAVALTLLSGVAWTWSSQSALASSSGRTRDVVWRSCRRIGRQLVRFPPQASKQAAAERIMGTFPTTSAETI